MPQVNPDPHKTTYQFLPQRCVTATFDSPVTAAAATTRLREAGFAESAIRVYIGEEGANEIDIDAEKQSLPTKLLQSLTKALADDAGYLERAAGKLRQGGAFVSVTVDEDQEAAERASAVLKAAGGEGVQHWGDWTTEQL
jgi:hypothetical protein